MLHAFFFNLPINIYRPLTLPATINWVRQCRLWIMLSVSQVVTINDDISGPRCDVCEDVVSLFTYLGDIKKKKNKTEFCLGFFFKTKITAKEDLLK